MLSAFHKFEKMVRAQLGYLSSILRNFVPLSALSQAKQTHAHSILRGLLPNVTLETDLLLAYSKCGSIKDARQVFDRMRGRNMHSWNILISSYVQNSMHLDSLLVFDGFLKMGLLPDHFTFPPLLKASSAIEYFHLGQALHGWVVRLGYAEYIVVGGAVLDFYVKRGILDDAWRWFADMIWRDSVVWNLMILGFYRAGLFADALNCFKGMLKEGLKMDSWTIPSILNACGGEGDLIYGKEIHGQVVKSSTFDRNAAIGNALIYMYANCGCLPDSEKAFRNIHELNTVTWTTMISSYGVHGKGNDALIMFKKMQELGHVPNTITITAALASCSHSGLLEQGREIFHSIHSEYGFEPSVEHYACMADLFGRCGYIEEALALINNMKFEATASVWGALLSSCVMHKNVEVGELAANKLFELEPRNASNYIALSSIYRSLGLREGVLKIRIKMRQLGFHKLPGCSWITVAGTSHKFYQGDLSHPFSRMICRTINGISEALIFPEMHELGSKYWGL